MVIKLGAREMRATTRPFRKHDTKRWTYGLFRREERDRPELCAPDVPARARATTYLSDILDPGGSDIIISKVVYFDARSDKEEVVKDIRAYTSFGDYPSLYFYVESSLAHERVFHEVFPSRSRQKPRFDIDISREAYKEFAHLGASFEDLGEYVKDIVIRSCITVLTAYGVSIDIGRDFCVFTSHGRSKRSYHIVLSKWYHDGSEQAREFYNLCSRVHVGEVDRPLFERLVDSHVYSRNSSLRLVWSVKDPDGPEPRIKEYCPSFTYEGQLYKHVLFPPAVSETKERVEDPRSISNLYILSHSLITCCDGLTPMPTFFIRPSTRQEEVDDMSQETYQECLEIIRKWNTEGVYAVDGESEGKIQLHRQKPSMCEICTWKTEPHTAMDGFCHIYNGNLLFHCGRCKGRGKILGALSTVRSARNDRLREYAQMLSACRSKEYTVSPKGRTQEAYTADSKPPEPPRMYLRPPSTEENGEGITANTDNGIIASLLSSDCNIIPQIDRSSHYVNLSSESVAIKEVSVIRQLALPQSVKPVTATRDTSPLIAAQPAATQDTSSPENVCNVTSPMDVCNVIRVVRPPRVKREPQVVEEKMTFAQSIRGASAYKRSLRVPS